MYSESSGGGEGAWGKRALDRQSAESLLGGHSWPLHVHPLQRPLSSALEQSQTQSRQGPLGTHRKAGALGWREQSPRRVRQERPEGSQGGAGTLRWEPVPLWSPWLPPSQGHAGTAVQVRSRCSPFPKANFASPTARSRSHNGERGAGGQRPDRAPGGVSSAPTRRRQAAWRGLWPTASRAVRSS